MSAWYVFAAMGVFPQTPGRAELLLGSPLFPKVQLKRENGVELSAFFLQYSGENRSFAMSFAGLRAVAPMTPLPGQWHHLVGVRDASAGQLRLYVDGQLARQVDACSGTESIGPLVIGRGRFGGNPVDYWRGALDEVHVYDRALGAAEVDALYTSGR
ncbi:LamG-like jellyroll fold domain-containing protein [Micromonospora sp. NPDC050276]|uniref:LamG domain-containing protein n=1 Tax=Micromonospora sp. NPDC050276 TaxID=3364278 RepID=UPI00379891F4